MRDDNGLDAEIEAHLDELAARYVRQGLSEVDARLAARRDFGGVTRVREDYRAQTGRVRRWLDQGRLDARYSLRTLTKAPTFSLVVVLTLALGIGVNATLFSLADAVLFRPYPFADPDSLVIAGETVTDTRAEVSYLTFLDWRERSRSFDGLAAMGLNNWTMTLRAGEPRTLLFRAVSGSWFDVLGASAALGRTIGPLDDVRGAPRVLVLGYGLWQREFGGRADVIGQSLSIDDTPFTVVGVMPRDFGYPLGAEAWTALVPALAAIRSPGLPDFLTARGAGVLHLVGRLKQGVSIDRARAELDPLAAELARASGRPGMIRARLTALTDDLLGSSRAALLALLGAVGLLLLVTLANVAGLMLIRASRRRPEYAIRMALGASSGAIARQFLWEGGILALAATVLAVALSWLSLPALLASVPDIPRVHEAVVDWRVLAVAAGAGVLTTLVCWATPLLGIRRGGLSASMLSAGRSVAAGGMARGARSLLVTFEIAVTVVLLTGAGLMYRSVSRVMAVDLGFDASHLLAVQLGRPSDIADGDAVRQFYERAMDSLRALPDVEAVGAAGSRPLKGPIGLDSSWQFDGQSRAVSRGNPWANLETITPGYFEAMKTKVVQGRLFDERDHASGQPVVIVSESLARFAWPGQSPLGRRLRTAATDRDETDTWCVVVGVVPDMRYRALGTVSLDVYAPVTQSPFSAEDIMVRTRGATASVAALVRARLRELNPASVVTIDAMDEALSAHQAPWRANLAFFGVFAALTLLLSALGLYTVLSSSVSERIREIGVRLTLGASPREIVAAVLAAGSRLTLAGAAIGVVIAVLFAGTARALLFEIDPRDLVALLAAPVIVGLIALAACAVPAIRASRVDPAITLRAE